MYFPFARGKAFDTFDDGITYIAEILPGLYHIAMGYDFLEEGHRSPDFSNELMEWVRGHVEKA
jgi:hypothetical protein